LRKGNLTPPEAKMWPSQVPFQPTVQHQHRNGRAFPPNYLHESWLDHLYWDTELEPRGVRHWPGRFGPFPLNLPRFDARQRHRAPIR
jgi:hypothetical protein